MFRIIFSGSGGQGVMFMGKLIAQAALLEGNFVSVIPCYGAEMRGGTAYCMVSISKSEINSPLSDKVDILVALNEPSLKKFHSRVKDKGLILVNNSLAKFKPKTSAKVIYKPFSVMAAESGNIKIANMFALGSIVKISGIIKLGSVIKMLEGAFINQDLLELNKKAISKGMKLIYRR